ncbi:hypothetical protein NXC12_PE00292 (plasmid) [Rhizobium etli]|uniref:Uncharacterized protein n=1 Tax=Rhizobium etli TaxID=29449 RepID=A0AAN1ENN2_RHIET|nr:hypothetical protein [Rhizobium etli]AGS26422.1 hypothetical protein REMIM1_PF00758 [Rhizobium etli bv. mimosae str. Mim1]ARQ13888.1 hypothetical protein NXC12_PE00292 [Rhizobium etli]
MHQFLETTFGPEELDILDSVLEEWRAQRAFPKDSPDVELAAAVMFHLFREGNRTVETLNVAASEHRALSDL